MNRRVVVTGLGVISPVGNSVSEFWNSVLEGKSGIGNTTRFDVSAYASQISGEIKKIRVDESDGMVSFYCLTNSLKKRREIHRIPAGSIWQNRKGC